ncbi:hypothetical protein AAG570_011942 [Ranatra chinensis]|uniref:Uncharacterized protein n=1 Tax=Ranatra chinensis TaxID=642074 RepID=A0ABD0YHN3_9HEMI
MFLLRLAWESRARLPLLIASGFMALGVRIQLEINIDRAVRLMPRLRLEEEDDEEEEEEEEDDEDEDDEEDVLSDDDEESCGSWSFEYSEIEYNLTEDLVLFDAACKETPHTPT